MPHSFGYLHCSVLSLCVPRFYSLEFSLLVDRSKTGPLDSIGVFVEYLRRNEVTNSGGRETRHTLVVSAHMLANVQILKVQSGL